MNKKESGYSASFCVFLGFVCVLIPSPFVQLQGVGEGCVSYLAQRKSKEKKSIPEPQPADLGSKSNEQTMNKERNIIAAKAEGSAYMDRGKRYQNLHLFLLHRIVFLFNFPGFFPLHD